MKVESLAGSKYFVTFIDDKSRWCEIYFLKKKGELFEKFLEFKAKVEKQTGKNIKTVRSDNGGEYRSNELQNYLKKEGICHQLTTEYTPQQNGIAERRNRTLAEMARCMLLQSGLPPSFWAEAILTAASFEIDVQQEAWKVKPLMKFGEEKYLQRHISKFLEPELIC